MDRVLARGDHDRISALVWTCIHSTGDGMDRVQLMAVEPAITASAGYWRTLQ